jgi:DNA-binding helix-hairpin-helix protein with protein kinase domain
MMIFKMLFMGRHPYAGVPDRPGDFLLEKAIASFMFAFSPKARSLGVSPPGNCLALGSLPDNLIALFETAFLRGSELGNTRPSADQWGRALAGLEASLSTCSHDPAHRFPKQLKSCPWCAIRDGGGPDFFVSVSISSNVSVGSSNGTLWGAINAVIPVTFTFRARSYFVVNPVSATPLTANVGAYSVTFVVGLCVLALSAVLVLGGMPIGWLGGLLAWALLAQGKETTELKKERETREKTLKLLEDELAKAERDIQQIPPAYQIEFHNLKQTLQTRFERYMKLDQEKAKELQSLQANLAEVQKRDYLDQQLISRASIDGIGPGRKATLAAYGIESALDIHRGIRVPGIGATFTQRLVNWRGRVEANFRFNPALGLPKQQLHQLDVKILDIRRTLEAELRQGQQALSALGINALTRIRQVENRMAALVQQHAKAKSDVDVLP